MNAIQTQYIKAQNTVDTLRAVVEGKLSRVNVNGLEGRARRCAKREARLALSQQYGLLTAEKALVDAENALIVWGMELSGVTLEQECLLDSTFRSRIITETLRVQTD